jgi:hypothetical protein
MLYGRESKNVLLSLRGRDQSGLHLHALFEAVRAISEYLEQLDMRIEDAEARVEHNQQSRIDLLMKDLSLAKKTLERQTQERRRVVGSCINRHFLSRESKTNGVIR